MFRKEKIGQPRCGHRGCWRESTHAVYGDLRNFLGYYCEPHADSKVKLGNAYEEAMARAANEVG